MYSSSRSPQSSESGKVQGVFQSSQYHSIETPIVKPSASTGARLSPNSARAMGEWYGRCLKESGLYDDVEVVVPLPLHPVKRCRRGYNQSEYIAEGIAAQLGVEVDRRSVRRKRNTESQALKARRDRARNVEDAFAVGRPGRLAGRHVLLVDDVFTTGSTMLSCAGEILRSAPGCRISIAALAVSRHALGEKG